MGNRSGNFENRSDNFGNHSGIFTGKGSDPQKPSSVRYWNLVHINISFYKIWPAMLAILEIW